MIIFPIKIVYKVKLYIVQVKDRTILVRYNSVMINDGILKLVQEMVPNMSCVSVCKQTLPTAQL